MSVGNNIILIGRLGADPEMAVVGDGKVKASFSIAVDRPYKKGEADFFNISAWGKTAELCGDFLTKGKQIALEGYLQIRKFDKKDGTAGYYTEVVAEDIKFLGKKDD